MMRIKIARQGCKMTAKEAADRLGIPYSTYYSYERGDREPSIELIVKMCGLFECAADFLLGIGPRKTKPAYQIGEEMTAKKCAAELERLISARERMCRTEIVIEGEAGFLKRENDPVFPVYEFALSAVQGCIPKTTKCSCGYKNKFCPNCGKRLKEEN